MLPRPDRTMIDDRQGTPMTARENTQRHRRFTPYAVGLLALAALGACSSSGAAETPGTSSAPPTAASTTTSAKPPTTTSTPSPTSSEDPVNAKIPKAARAHTQEGAEAFARFYMEQVNKGFTEADPSSLEGLGAPSCETCSSFFESTKDLKARGHHHKGLSISVDGALANSYTPKKAIVQLFVTQHSVPVVDRRGKEVDHTKAGEGIFLATLSFGNRWVIERIQVAR